MRIPCTRAPARSALRAAVFPALIALCLARGSAAAPAADSAGSSIFFPKPRPNADTTVAARRAHAQEKYKMGRALESAHEPAAAIVAYRTAVQLDSMIADANYRMGMLFLTVNQLRPAARCFNQEVRHHPENIEAARQLGFALARLGMGAAAVERLEPITRRAPRDAESWAALGFAYMTAQRPGAADSALRRAIALNPKNATWHRDLGVVLAARGMSDEARREYRRAAQLDPKDASPWIDLGNLELREGRLDAALAAYREAAKRDSLSPLAVEGEAKTLSDMKRPADAGEVYRRWLARRPDDHNARLEAIRLYDDMGRSDISLEIARDGVRALPDSPDAHLLLGMALQSAGDWRGGVAEMRTAEARFTTPDERARVRALIGSMRGQAPDSLRAFFAADSVAHPVMAERPAKKPEDVR